MVIKISPALKTKDKSKEHLEIAKEYTNKISSNKGVIGVAVGGSLGRGHSDDFSDIDFYVYVDNKTFQRWKKKRPIKKGCHKYKGYEVETEIFNFDEEKKNKWLIQDRWERQHHFTLFDTNKKIENLIKQKCVWEKGEREELLKNLLHRSEWYLELHEDFIDRGDLQQAQYVINCVIDWILDSVFLKNNYFIPWPKWKFHYAKLMNKKPKDFEKEICEAMKIKSFDESDIKRRVRILEKILKKLK